MMVSHENGLENIFRMLVQNGTEVTALMEKLEKCKNNGSAVRELLENLQKEIVEKKAQEQDEIRFKKKKKLIIKEYGERNAKLICIKDENSICDDFESGIEDEDNKPTLHNNITEIQNEILPAVVRVSSQTQTVPVVIPKKKRKPLKLPPKEHILPIVQYKLCLYNFNKTNSLYMKSTMWKPWMLMGKIADNVLSTLLVSIVKEMELNDVLENLFRSEFQ